MLKDQNEEIRKFAIRNLRDLSESSKKIMTSYFDLNLISTLINYLLSTSCKKEIFEITTIVIKATFDDKRISAHILANHLNLITHLDNFLSLFPKFENLDFHLAFNYITILTNLISDNNTRKLGFEQQIFEKFNIAYLFQLFQEMPKLPNFIRLNIIWLFTNCLKIKKSENTENKFLHTYWAELEKFLSVEKNLDIIIKFFNIPTISKMTTEILSFLLALYDLESEAIWSYLHKNLNFGNKIIEILRCSQENRTLILAFKLMNKMAYKELFGLRFYEVLNILSKLPFVFEYIEKDLLKYTSGSFSQIDSNNPQNTQQPGKTMPFNQEMITLLDNVIFFLAQYLDKKSSLAHRIFETQELFNTINNIFMLLTRNGVTKSLNSPVENYVYILSAILILDDNTVFFFEFVRCNVLDFLTDLLRKGLDDKGITLLVLKCLDSMLSLAEDLVDGSKNFIGLHLEKLGLDSIIDNFRTDNDDEIATVANSIIEIYFQSLI